MLDRTAPAAIPSSRPQPGSRRLLTKRFRSALLKSVEGILEACQVLVEGKQQLEHGEFTDWVENELPLGGKKFGMRKAQMMMNVARHPVLANANQWFAFPPSWRTLYELSHIRPPRMLQLISSKQIYAGMSREEAIALSQGRRQDSGQFILAAAISQLLQQSELLTDSEAVNDLRTDPGSVTPGSINQLCHWLRKVAEQWRETE